MADRPSLVQCAGPCRRVVEARDCYEALLVWSKTASGQGTMTGASAPLNSNLWVCPRCWLGRIDPNKPQPPERRVHAGELASLAARELKVLIPEHRELTSGEGRARFQEAMRAIERKETA